jgi:hypothetical protein
MGSYTLVSKIDLKMCILDEFSCFHFPPRDEFAKHIFPLEVTYLASWDIKLQINT